jgi:hypothetical protein
MKLKKQVELTLNFKIPVVDGINPPKEDSDNILANNRRIDMFEFDINHEIKELIKRYINRINMEYGTFDIDDVKTK